MTTTLSFSHSLFTTPFDHNTDFTALADNCARFVDVLAECDDPAQKMALCGRLSACLALLQPTLLEPVPEHLKASLTVDDLPLDVPVFEPEADQLGRYCQLLTQLLLSQSLSKSDERVAGDLLQELVSFYSDTLKAPRWLRTDEGVVLL
ncbi:hypothetical protein MXF13_20840 [Leclercia adecarboxylata]|uniref:hypothetical protein n=1 Tax=Leclercia TaxID=83654 RepID=UPI000CD171BA|nr:MULTISPECIES: hypothetical protein [Leclercia]POV32541.1 hypothetical protein C3388_20950 [Leclercia sp. LSNIH5]POW62461.1 hypothetical protein C3389_21415 [Leclercia sp. LSNIH2]AUU83072.1 hypothetical protein C2U54_03130 [Leclercia sp. LSNIH1]MCZ7838969.1 hypothetical protein [Leclercia adecarboxylata]MEB5752311.1 hypothetical protein [Leclercia adecarboxylata]